METKLARIAEVARNKPKERFTSLIHLIIGFCGKRNITYTRYADDISLSKNDPAILLKSKKTIINIIEDEGFNINTNKTRILRPGNRREITGLILTDDDEIRIGRKKKREIRAAIHHYIYGKKDVCKGHNKLANHIRGWLSFIHSVDEKSYKQLTEYKNKLINKAVANNIIDNEAAVTKEI